MDGHLIVMLALIALKKIIHNGMLDVPHANLIPLHVSFLVIRLTTCNCNTTAKGREDSKSHLTCSLLNSIIHNTQIL
jgi:hypothetical protein